MTKKEKLSEAKRIKEDIDSRNPKTAKTKGITEKQKEDNNKRRTKNSAHRNVPNEFIPAPSKKHWDFEKW